MTMNKRARIYVNIEALKQERNNDENARKKAKVNKKMCGVQRTKEEVLFFLIII